MKRPSLLMFSALVLICCTLVSLSQTAQNVRVTNATVPRLVRYTGIAREVDGKPATGVVGITFALYAEQNGGAPLWLETQNVQADNSGHYTALLGATKPDGLPTELFTSEQAHWIGVQLSGQAEQPRVLLVSAPYALKAGDAETLGGLPASAFALAAPPYSAATSAQTAINSPSQNGAPATTVTGTGTVGFVPLWDTTSDIISSVISQSGSGSTAKVGINTNAPTTALDVKGASTFRGTLNLPVVGSATATAGKDSQPIQWQASAFDSSLSAATNQTFQWMAEPAANNTASPSGTLNLLFGAGTSGPSETGLSIASNGVINFAKNQTFFGTNSTSTGNGVEGSVTATSGSAAGVYGTTASPNGTGVYGISTSTTNSVIGGVGVYGFSSNPSGYGVEGTSGNIGVIGNGGSIGSSTGVGVQGNGNQYGVYGSTNNSLFPAVQAGVYGTTSSGSATAYGVQGIAASTTGSPVGVYGLSSSAAGFGVEGVSGNIGVYGNAGASSIGVGVEGVSANVGVIGKGKVAGVAGLASMAGALSGLFQGGPVSVAGNDNNTLIGDAGCGSGYAGIGFTTSVLSGCTNYALLGGPSGGTFVNAGGTASIHFRSNNNELATIDNSGNVDVIGQNGGGNLKVSGKVSSGNVIAQVAKSNSTGANNGRCTGTLNASNSNCLVPNMTLTKTTANPSVLVMANIGGVTTDPCVVANFYLVVDNKIVALSSVSSNTNNDTLGYEISSLTILSLQTLAAGSHTFQVQEADDNSSGGCNTFIGASGVSEGDGARGSQRVLIVREF